MADEKPSHYITIDFEELEKLCGIQCTKEECAAFLGCSADTIERRVREKYGIEWLEYYERHSGVGRVSLRRKQHQVAVEDGNVQMLIHLGKQRLGQKDKIETEVNNKIQINIDGDDGAV